MPNLSDNAVASWLAERDPELLASFAPAPALPPRLALAIVEFGRELDAAQASDPHKLAGLLRSGPLQERMQLLLAQMDVSRRLRMLAWFGTPPMPEPYLVVNSYLARTSRPESRLLYQELQGLHRNALLLRIFRHERITALLAGCQIAGQAEEMA